MMVRWLVAAAVICGGAWQLAWGEAPTGVFSLAEFGPLDKPSEVQAAYESALARLQGEGGVLVVPASQWRLLKPASLQGLIRVPEAPAETKQWRTGKAGTIVVVDEATTTVKVPPLTGLRLERELRLDAGDSAPHWGTHPLLTLDSKLVYGAVSYLDWIQAPVEKGLDRRFYVPTIRGLRPGQFVNIHGGPGYGGGVTRACIKSLGFDPEKNLHFVVADTSIDHRAGAILHNKSNVGLIHMLQTSHNDNQTYDVKVIRNQYAHGDTYIYYCDFNYMSNVHSAAGDENGNCFSAFIRSLDNHFRGTVEGLDWNASQLRFTTAAQNVETLGDSRPLVNRNPQKALTAGKVWIVSGRTDFDLPDPAMSTFQGRDYTTSLVTNPITNARERRFGGLIRGDRDCPWTPDVVGRFFAVDHPSERTPKGSYRWYLITKFQANPDGTKEIEVQRFWWGAKSAGSPTLYRTENYTWDGHERPLPYVIAPGAYVNDVSRAVAGGDRGGQRTLGLAPHAAMNTPFDFEPGDPVEQAIGPDPFKPQPMRVWMWEDVPGQFPSAVFDVANYGAASRYSVLSVAGGPANLDEVPQRHEQKPAWDNILVVNSAATIGLNFKADFAKAAILFQQPHHEQKIEWHFGHEPTGPDDPTKSGITKAVTSPPVRQQTASLSVDRSSGQFQFVGGGLSAGGGVSNVAGLSGDATPAQNLRGKNLAVPARATTFSVTFPRPEADAEYSLFLEQSWLTLRAVTEKRVDGFTVTFEKEAPAGAKLDWMLVR